MRTTLWMLTGLIALAAGPVWAAEDETGGHEQQAWARWQGRLSLGNAATPAAWAVEAPAQRPLSASVMGDYYFSRAFFSAPQLGGFRATSGLIFGPRGVLSTGQPSATAGSQFSIGSRLFGQATLPSSIDPAADSATLPYLGLGYTGLSARSGWSFSADLGLVAQSTAVRLGRVFTGGQSLDDAVRDMRLAPLVQLGVSYSF